MDKIVLKGRRFSILCIVFLLLAGCAGNKKKSNEIKIKIWDIIPASVALGVRTECVLKGENLYSAHITNGPSVVLEKGEALKNGKALQLFVTVNKLVEGDSVDVKGKRKLEVSTLDQKKELILKVVDEENEY